MCSLSVRFYVLHYFHLLTTFMLLFIATLFVSVIELILMEVTLVLVCIRLCYDKGKAYKVLHHDFNGTNLVPLKSWCKTL